MEWIKVKTKADLPDEDHLWEDEPKYVVRIYHDDRGSHIEELTQGGIWEAALGEDGAVYWLKERDKAIITPSKEHRAYDVKLTEEDFKKWIGEKSEPEESQEELWEDVWARVSDRFLKSHIPELMLYFTITRRKE